MRTTAGGSLFFDDLEPARKEYGWGGHTVCRDPDDPNLVVIVGRVKDLNRAKEFAQSDSLRAAIMNAGVQGSPEILFLQDEEDKKY